MLLVEVQSKAIQNCNALAISDGSFKFNRGTSAGVVEEEGDPSSRMIVFNKVPGLPKVQSPYRSELAGVCGIITLIETIIQNFAINKGRIKIGLDGESAVKKLRYPESMKVTNRSFDLLQFILLKVKKMPIKVEFFWVKGHQDDLHTKTSYEGEINIQCDSLAKAFWNRTMGESDNCCHLKVNRTGWSLSLNGIIKQTLTRTLYTKRPME